MQEGVAITTARLLEVKRDARIALAQVEEARAKLSLLRAGAREEDIRQAESVRGVAQAQVEAGRARLTQCVVRAPADGVVLDVLSNPGQFMSTAVPQPLLHVLADGSSARTNRGRSTRFNKDLCVPTCPRSGRHGSQCGYNGASSFYRSCRYFANCFRGTSSGSGCSICARATRPGPEYVIVAHRLKRNGALPIVWI
jgi:hypothetical protein